MQEKIGLCVTGLNMAFTIAMMMRMMMTMMVMELLFLFHNNDSYYYCRCCCLFVCFFLLFSLAKLKYLAILSEKKDCIH